MTTEEFEKAFTEEDRRYLFGLAMRQVKNPDDADNIVQQALADAFEKLDSFRGDSTVRTWLGGFVANHCKRHFAQRRRGARRYAPPVEEGAFAPTAAKPARRSGAKVSRRTESPANVVRTFRELRVDAAALTEALASASEDDGAFVPVRTVAPQVVGEEDDPIRRLDLKKALATLPTDIRHVIERKYGLGETWVAIAADSDIDPKTLEAKVRPYLQKLRNGLAAWELPVGGSE